MAMYTARRAINPRRRIVIADDVFRMTVALPARVLSIILASGMKRMIQRKKVYRTSSTVKKRKTHDSKTIAEIIDRKKISRESITVSRTSFISKAGRKLINKGDIVPRLCGVFKNVTDIG